MKPLIAVALCLILAKPVQSQIEIDPLDTLKVTLSNESGLYKCVRIVNIEGTKEQIMPRISKWAATSFKNPGKAGFYIDSDAGIFKVNPTIPVDWYLKSGTVDFGLLVEVKDEKIRVTFSDLAYYSTGSGRVSFDGPMFGKGKAVANMERELTTILRSLVFSILKEDEW